ncbi:unnamed protein product [Miscanthus lutarioriparius]|uniref:BHLH domain-containing protein n=1 Tax=Miscanthus lutarioriparius TaxID=422564 RepID=A0A811S7C7_9POAL|nr:unnamed protein product [Miscanthus lutarioriparius]
MPSLSIGSPEYSSFIRSMATSAAASASAATGAAEPSSQELQLHPAVPLLPGLPAPVYGPHGQAPFLDPDNEQAAMTQAILAVISSSAPPPPASIAVPPASSFRAYNAALSPRARPRPGAPGQRMIKTAIALMASVQMAMRHRELAEARQHEDASAAAQPHPPTQQQHTSSQLHHMFSERRRRERLNESFQTLRALLPLGTKKDKATVLANTTEYMNKLIAEVSELEERNRRLEAQLGLLPGETQQTPSDDDPPQRVAVDVTTAASTSSSTSCQPQEVSIRVTVRAECDLSEVVVAMLARIKEMGRFTVATVDARQRSSDHAQVGITLRATGGNDELDETSLKEAVAKAVEDAVARPPSPP